MAAILAMSFGEYMDFYYKFAIRQWNNLTPTSFSILLITVAVIGYLMMRSSTKRI